MDGTELAGPMEIIPYEIRFANAYCRPFWEATYTRRPGSMEFTAESIMNPASDFDYSQGSGLVDRIAGLDREIERLWEKLRQRERQVNRLQGQIKAWKTKWANRRKSCE